MLPLSSGVLVASCAHGAADEPPSAPRVPEFPEAAVELELPPPAEIEVMEAPRPRIRPVMAEVLPDPTPTRDFTATADTPSVGYFARVGGVVRVRSGEPDEVHGWLHHAVEEVGLDVGRSSSFGRGFTLVTTYAIQPRHPDKTLRKRRFAYRFDGVAEGEGAQCVNLKMKWRVQVKGDLGTKWYDEADNEFPPPGHSELRNLLQTDCHA